LTTALATDEPCAEHCNADCAADKQDAALEPLASISNGQAEVNEHEEPDSPLHDRTNDDCDAQ
jgi:hypothetical protein